MRTSPEWQFATPVKCAAYAFESNCYDSATTNKSRLVRVVIVMALLRYLPDVPLPPYTYVSGRTPHPIRDPAGHMYGDEPGRVELLVDDWPQCRPYLRGIDLFNHGYYWEAHEVWESLWHAAGRTGPVADFFKGLIKLAAAGVKTLEGSLSGRARHARRAAQLFRIAAKDLACRDESRFMGLSLSDLAGHADAAAREPDASPIADRRSVFSFQLTPG
ncbi:MAG: DUF309 domain-containing protein [Planctomycetaceae bacterium]|nr:DUF309 domain-containing protein [Planctomycetaceae bacterium]